MVDENCLTNSTLDLKDDNTAILSLTSILSSNFEIVEGTENELEEIINCENIEDIKQLTWVVGNYEVTNPDGSTTMVSSRSNTLRLFEQNGSVLFTGLIVNDKLSLNSSSDNFINAEVEGNIVAFSNLKNLHFYK